MLGQMHPSATVNLSCEPDADHFSDVYSPFSILSQFNSADGLPSIATWDLRLYSTGDFKGPSYVLLHCSDWQCSQVFTVEWVVAQPLAASFNPSFAAALRDDATSPVYFFRNLDLRYRLVLCRAGRARPTCEQ